MSAGGLTEIFLSDFAREEEPTPVKLALLMKWKEIVIKKAFRDEILAVTTESDDFYSASLRLRFEW